MVVLYRDLLRGMGARRNFEENLQSGHALSFKPEIKDERGSVKDVAPERLRCETIQKEVSKTLKLMTAGAAPSAPIFLQHQCLSASSWWCSPHSTPKRLIKIAGEIFPEVRHLVALQSFGIETYRYGALIFVCVERLEVL